MSDTPRLCATCLRHPSACVCLVSECLDCGEVTPNAYCDPCADRRWYEAKRESSNEYRRQAQIRLDLEMVRRRTRAYVERAGIVRVPHRLVWCRPDTLGKSE